MMLAICAPFTKCTCSRVSCLSALHTRLSSRVQPCDLLESKLTFTQLQSNSVNPSRKKTHPTASRPGLLCDAKPFLKQHIWQLNGKIMYHQLLRCSLQNYLPLHRTSYMPQHRMCCLHPIVASIQWDTADWCTSGHGKLRELNLEPMGPRGR